jgi:transcriptional regulator with XRE-family HTH domain
MREAISTGSISRLAKRARSVAFVLAWLRRPRYNVAEAVIRLRRLRGMSQAELAELMKTQQPAIARIEAGAANLRLSSLEQLAEALNATIRIELAPTECLRWTVQKRAWWDEPENWLLLGGSAPAVTTDTSMDVSIVSTPKFPALTDARSVETWHELLLTSTESSSRTRVVHATPATGSLG